MEYNRALNSALFGWALTLIAIVLNIMTWLTGLGGYRGLEILGIVFGVLTLACSHFGEGLAAVSFQAGHDARRLRSRVSLLSRASMVLCTLSYFTWLYAVLTA